MLRLIETYRYHRYNNTMVIYQQNHSSGHFISFIFTKKGALILIAIIGIFVYWNSLFGSFLWDDVIAIQKNDTIKSLSNFLTFFSNNGVGNNEIVLYYRPFLYLSFSLIYTIFGSRPFFFHLFQVLIHVLNSSMLFIFMNTIFDKAIHQVKEKKWENLSGSQKIKYTRIYDLPKGNNITSSLLTNAIALFLALIFLVHPINVESVSYISGLNDPLYFIFGLFAIFLSLKESISFKRIIIISLLLLCSLFSKETGILFLFIVPLFYYLFKKKEIKALLLIETIIFAVYSYTRFAIGDIFFQHLNYAAIAKLTFLERLINIPRIVLYYFSTLVLPWKLTIDQQWIVTSMNIQDFYLPILIDGLVFACLLTGGIYVYKYRKCYFSLYLFFFLWFLSGLAFLMQIFPLSMTVADRWFYFPLVGILGMLGTIMLTSFSQNEFGYMQIKNEKIKRALILLGLFIICLFALRTIIRNANFHDEIKLYEHDTQIQNNFSLENDLGIDYYKIGDMSKALTHFQKSVSIYPYSDNLFHLGLFYDIQNNIPKAKEYYSKAVSTTDKYYSVAQTRDPRDEYLFTRLTELLLISSDYKIAEKVSKKGLLYYPNSIKLWEELAVTESKLHNQREALISIEKAKSLSSNTLTNILYDTIVTKQEIQQNMPTIIMKN